MITFGNRLKEARKIKRLTQKQLAEKIGAKHNSVSDWENDKNKPDPDTIELICGILDISASYLLGTKDPLNLLSPEAVEIARIYDSADYERQNIVRLTLGLELKRRPEAPGQLALFNLEDDNITPLPQKEETPEHLKVKAARPIPGVEVKDSHDEDIINDPNF